MEMIPHRGIRTGANRRPAPQTVERDPVDDLAVLFLDCLLGSAKFTPQLLRAVIASLDFPSRIGLGNALLRGKTPEEIATLAEEGGDGPSLANNICEALDAWRGKSPGLERDTDPLCLDPTLAEREATKAFEACHAGRELRDPFTLHRERLAVIFGLGVDETEFLCLLQCAFGNESLDGQLAIFLNCLSITDFHRAVAAVLGRSVLESKNLLASTGRLLQMGFVSLDYFPPPHFKLSSDMSKFFADPDSLYSMVVPLDRFLAETGKSIHPLESFPVTAFCRQILESILRNERASVLIHGAPGTGKTTFIATVLASMGIPAFILSAVGGAEDGRPLFIRLKVAAHVAKGAKAVLVIDEADSLLNTETFAGGEATIGKGWLAEFMDSNSGAIVMISNRVNEMHDAVKRRFLYSLDFKPQNEAQRAMLWRELVKGYGLEGSIGPEAIDLLSKSHNVNAGGIDIALRGLRGVVGLSAGRGTEGGTPVSSAIGDPVAILSEILGRHEILMSGSRPAAWKGSRGEDRLYLPEAINVDTPLDELVAGLKGVAAGIMARRDSPATNGAAPGARAPVLEAKLLFSGAPGTGKTAFARWLATALGLKLVQKRASDLLGFLVGVTEQNIAAAFEEAENEGAILLLDEADSLFINRRNARQSWERSQTNELLTRMEDFAGILICCTNLREALDEAALRRFQWKISFLPLLPRYRVELYRRYFDELCGAPDDEVLSLASRLEGLCPGDFSAVYKALVPIRAAILPDRHISHEMVLARLRSEIGARDLGRGRVLGFGAG